MRRLIALVPLALFALVGLFFLRGFERDPREIPSALIDKPLPDFDLAPLPGFAKGLATSDFKGEVQLLNVFASWCGPCRAEHPVIGRLAEREHVPVRAINWKDQPQAALAWLKTNGNPYASVGVDPENHAGIDLGVYGVPESFVVDKAGVIRLKVPGPISPAILDEQILPLIATLRRE